MGERLFGTDGIRAKVGTYPLTEEMVTRIGQAVAYLWRKGKDAPLIIVGRDTRLSGPILEQALLHGLVVGGARVFTCGVLPTPAVAYLTRALKADLGIIISASHNPWVDNGLKFFDGEGFKLSEEKEGEIEELLALRSSFPSAAQSIPPSFFTAGESRYIQFLRRAFSEETLLKDRTIVLDCANGATYRVAPKVFTLTGGRVITVSAEPDGKNINENCGSQYPEKLAAKVLAEKADVGFAFDGDGDRVIAVDEKGCILTGDQILAALVAFRHKEGKLKNNLVVRTVMSNMGITQFLRERGINYITTDVGDRAVLKAMLTYDAELGGEDSGHIILLDRHTTGDGLLTALALMFVLKKEKKPLSELVQGIKIFPQRLINVEVTKPKDVLSVPQVARTVKEVETELGTLGRVLIRPSGTQPLYRIMVESPDPELTERCAERLAAVVREALS